MNKKQKEEIQNSLRICKMKLETIMPHLTEEKPILNRNFNELLIEKAILRDKLMKKKNNSFLSKLVKKVVNPKKEYICDYFKG